MNDMEPAAVLTRDDLEESIAAFTNSDWLRLRSVAQLYACLLYTSDAADE